MVGDRDILEYIEIYRNDGMQIFFYRDSLGFFRTIGGEKRRTEKGSCNEVRMRVVQKFSEEKLGTGRDDEASGYTYYVGNNNEREIFYGI